MHVYEGNTELQSVSFTYRHRSIGARSLLTGVTFTDKVTGKTRAYTLRYLHETEEYSPATKAVDRHGYYNGHEENTDLVERHIVEFNMAATGTHSTYYGYIGGADRSPSADYACYYSLQSIGYPDGASETFSYGLNLYTDDFGQEQYAGGLRVERVELRDAELNVKSSYDAFTSKNGVYLNNVVSDSKSMSSLLYHLYPSSKNPNRAQQKIMGTTYQFYIWQTRWRN